VTEERRFRPARLAGRESAGGGLTRVTVEPEPSLLASHRHPGQYVEMRVHGETGFFVLSNEPGSAAWQLVMRAGGGASDVVLAIPVGSSLELTGALGEGFPMDAAAGHPLVVALNGTGVAAAPPIVRRRVRDGDARITRVYLGVRARDEVPIEPELRAWGESGVDVVVCLSQPAQNPPPGASTEGAGKSQGVAFASGYVQDVVRDRVAPGSLAGGRIFAVGSSSMIDALRARVSELGLHEARIHTNY
jgi:NAD(P)H-flavin reductase